jgi:hypothetical protein
MKKTKFSETYPVVGQRPRHPFTKGELTDCENVKFPSRRGVPEGWGVLFMVFAIFSITFAAPSEQFAAANKLYDEKMYDSATVLYLDMLNSGETNSAILHNISNCAYRSGDIGAAILYSERAARLSPDDEDIRANLEFLRKQTNDKFEIPEQTFGEKLLNSIQGIANLETQILIIVILSGFVVVILGFTLFSTKFRTAKIYSMIILSFLALVIGVFAIIKYNSEKNNVRAVVMSEILNAVNEPRGNKTIFSVHEGTVLRIIKENGEWIFVSLPNGASGWTEKTHLEKI